MHRTLLHLGIAVLALGLGLLSAAAAQPMTTVSVQDELFNPAQLQTTSGTMITWANVGGEQHTITADDGSFDSGTINTGDTFSFTFAGPGMYPYYCQIHGGPGGQGMSGTIVVGS